MLTEKDLKPTGRQLFEQRKNIIEEVKLDEGEEDADYEEYKQEEGGAEEAQPDEETQYYDKALYEVDFDEDVDFE